MIGGKVPDQDGVIALDWGALLLKAEVRINVVDDPSVIVSVFFGGQGSLLLA